MSEVAGDVRWGTERVLAQATSDAARQAARALAAAGRVWEETGHAAGADPPTVWALCRGSATKPYQTCVDLAEPAYRCSCPSRRTPCKHAVALLLRWAQGAVPAGEPPPWVKEWHAGRAGRAERRASTGPRGPVSDQARARRAERVRAGLDELDRWLADQIRHGLAGASRAGYAHWEAMAARLVDAQAPGAAGMVRRLAWAATDPSGERLLAELALLRLLVTAYRRVDGLPADLAATVRSRVGLPVPADEVLAGPRLRDDWRVIGQRDQVEERLTTRRTWLHGTDTGRFALVLSFAAPGQTVSGDLTLGTVVDADLCFYPGAQPLRALVAASNEPVAPTGPPPGPTVSATLEGYAEALARDPWLDRWPVLVGGALMTHAGGWHLRDGEGAGLRLDPAGGDPWRLVGAAGGLPLTVAGEWSPSGLRPLTGWVDGRLVRA